MNQNIFYIIVTYNGERWINKCLSSIHLYGNLENTIIVDNASTDNTVAIIKKDFPKVKLVNLDQNLGFGSANNLAIKKAKELGAEYLFLLNQDVYLEDKEFWNLTTDFEKHSDFGIISPIHLSSQKESLDFLFLRYINEYDTPQLINDFVLGKVKPFYKTVFVNAAAWIVPMRVFETIGLFHPVFYHYGEDYDFVKRLKRAGFSVQIFTKSQITHDRSQKRQNSPLFRRNELLRRQLLAMFLNDPDFRVRIASRRFLILFCKNILGLRFNDAMDTLNSYFKFLQDRKKAAKTPHAAYHL